MDSSWLACDRGHPGLFLNEMDGDRIANRATYHLGGARLVGGDLEIAGTVDKDEQGSALCFVVGSDQLGNLLIADLEKTEARGIESAAASPDGSAYIAEMVDA